MKKFLALILTLTLLFCCVPFGAFNITASAATSGTTGDCTWSLNGTVLTISGNGKMGNYDTSLPWGTSITEVIIQDGVTSIGYEAFFNYSSLTSITIPDSVTSIGSSAFYSCSSLTSITIPDSVTSIGYDVFYNTAYYNDNSNWENDVLYIGKHLIEAKDTVSGEYTIKDGTLTIAAYAFEDCSSLTSITIGDSVTSIGYRAFYDCDAITSITIGKSVTSIGNYAFDDCSSLTSITIPDSVTSIGNGVFYNTAYYNDNSNWENDVIYIGKHLIEAKDTVSGEYTIKDGTLTIAASAFSSCSSLTSITIPDSVTSIGDDAFWHCSSLTSITIPDSVISIGELAFTFCKSIKLFSVSPDNPNYSSASGVLFNNDKTILMYYPAAKPTTSYTIPDSVTSIGNLAFCDCDAITSITIPDSVTSIGNRAFEDCSKLTSLTIPDSVTSIGYEAFFNCSSLTSITIPDSVTSIGNHAFSYCSYLTSITIGKSVTSIGNYAFSSCSNLKTVYYRGSETDKSKIKIGSYNSMLTNATWYYNACIGSAEHSYDNACDTTCNVCDFKRLVPDHVYDGICDAFCNECNLERTVPDHIYDGICDAFCNGCNLERTVPDHIYDNACDAFCNECNLERTVLDHVYDNACDAFCNECNFPRMPDVHKICVDVEYSFVNNSSKPFALKDGVYTSTNKTSASTSTATITCLSEFGTIKIAYSTSSEYNYDKLIIKHNGNTKVTASGTTDWTHINIDVKKGDTISFSYSKDNSNSSGKDEVYFKIESNSVPAEDIEPTCVDPVICSVCGVLVKEALGHSYTNVCDATCNNCNLERTVPEHIYDNACDAFCNECNLERTVPEHIYDNACDTVCNVCGFVRTVPDHIYDNACDAFCNECNLERTVPEHIFALNNEHTCEICKYSKKPTTPELEYKYSGTVVLKSHSYMEYSLDGIFWQDSNIFSNLNENTTYTFFQRVKASSVAMQSDTSEPLSVTLKAFQTAPNKPTAISATDNTVKLLNKNGYEYSLDGIKWQTSNVFVDLLAATKYNFYQRIAETESCEASAKSEALVLTTDKAYNENIPDAPTALEITANSITLNIVDGCEYSLDGINWQTSNVFENLVHATEYSFYQRFAETENSFASEISLALKVKTNKAVAKTPSAPTLETVTHNAVILKAVDGCEYSMDGENWQKSNIFKNLDVSTSYFFMQRVSETETHYASDISDALRVRTLDEPQYQKGDVDMNGTVNVSDLAALKKYIAGLLTEDEKLTVNPDVDENGTVNVSDLAILKKNIAGLV